MPIWKIVGGLLLSIIVVFSFTSKEFFTNLINDSKEVVTTSDTEEFMTVAEIIQEEPDLPHYEIDLAFDPKTRILSGTSVITYWNRSPDVLESIKFQTFLHSFQSDTPPILSEHLDKAYPSGFKPSSFIVHQATLQDKPTPFLLNDGVLQIHLEEPLQPLHKQTINLKWEGFIPDIHHRFGSYQDAFWFGNILPTIAVYNEGWETSAYLPVGDPFYTETANYQINIKIPTEYNVVSTGRVLAEHISDTNTKTVMIHADMVRDFTFAITKDHQTIHSETEHGKKVYFHYKNGDPAIVKAYLSMAVDMFDYMETRVGPYPYEHFHIFENKMFITGMEYPGIVFVSDHRLEMKDGYVTVLHEIAHQWFYNVIGNDQINEPYLDEGMATYFTDEFLQKEKLETYYSELTPYFDLPQLQYKTTMKYGNWSNYWRSTYRKASFMIFDLKVELGEEKFQQFLYEYYDTYKYGIVKSEQFKALVARYLPDKEAFFVKWGL